ncbi:hypothetical protein TRFO_12165 [Tritrichomonas foetus]|uniref:Leucine zipper transcription factor-like protein 1 n=1 Tax=Tritrichomonas foetus TaxID=1144522 RepID=A0A1J4J4A4_9EUKA|nr:hypothetical protein TRFO_12165 [Tritrichomonas foetus]|eukprot:OHS92975.1 hypothetical protein TRFO_12165 [Tritrichomonas foetus]
MSNQFSNLNNIHVQQFIDYLKFELRNRKEIEEEVTEELQDLLESRITASDTYTGQEVIDALEDIPDLVESTMDRQLEHVRDVTMVLIKNVFAQAKVHNTEIHLSVAQLEDETMLKNSHAFCNSLIKNPEEVLAAAPKAQGQILSRKPKVDTSSNDELEKLRQENAKLRAEIQAGLDEFPQYAKLKQMINEREIEIRGVKARL